MKTTTTKPKNALQASLSFVSEKGSLALEHVLFIAAVVSLSVGVFAFYNQISQYFTTVNVGNLGTQLDTTGGANNGTNNNGQ